MNLTPLTIVAAALVASLLGNAGLTRAYLTERDHANQAMTQAERNLEVAKQCSAGVEQLERSAQAQREAAAADVAAAQARAMDAQKRALVLAARPATRPGDDCGSAKDRIDQWMRER